MANPANVLHLTTSARLQYTSEQIPMHEFATAKIQPLASAADSSEDVTTSRYPEGGPQAWLCVFGSFCGMMSSLGTMNSIGTIQAYLSTHQLAGMSESNIGWIFSIYTFLAFFCSIQIGPLYDAKGPRWLVAVGSLLMLTTWLLLGICAQYWHFLVVFGIVGGIGTSLIFTPALASIAHFFMRRRGLSTGIAAAGGSLGGIIYPLVLQATFPQLGWAQSTRIIGYINIVLLVFTNLFVTSRLPFRAVTRTSIIPDLKILSSSTFALTTLGVFFVEWALFTNLTYLTSYSIAKGMNEAFAYQLIPIMHSGACFGRWLPGLLADKLGRFNILILTLFICVVTTVGLWLPAGNSKAIIIVYAVAFGFASGSGISLVPVCIGQLCDTADYGKYYATCYMFVSIACLTGIPIAGSILTATGGQYWGLILFSGLSYLISAAMFTAARVTSVGWKPVKVF